MSAHPAVHPPEHGPHEKLPAVLEQTDPFAEGQLCAPVEHSSMSEQLVPHPPGFWYPELHVHVPPLHAPFPHEHEAHGSIGVHPVPAQFGDPWKPLLQVHE
jgi:hypothetical protein